MTKPIGYTYWNKCKMCGIWFAPPIGKPHQIFCGSARQKRGCSYRNNLDLEFKWAKKHPEYVKKANRERMRKVNNSLPKRYWKKYRNERKTETNG